MSGLFITFEGPDGAGKTTQVNFLCQWLKESGIPFVRAKEPGGTAIGDKVRQLLLDPSHVEMADKAEILLYAASRAQLIEEVIQPALVDGQIVICDRYVDASLAYQGFGLGYPLRDIRAINDFGTGGIRPDRTYLLDLPAEEGIDRLQRYRPEGLDRMEQKTVAFHQRVRQGFLQLAAEEPARFHRIDARQSEDTIFTCIQTDLRQSFSLGGKDSEANYCRRAR
ncbi:dTMP kinase [Numidum massiliense]|uniref:dTMP kinase n=1 Tax=Numidum massiliense TaxID=1522315 RepID=UPI000A3FB730|nr:dTMP kinase [Numidum massiliense]